MEISGNIVNLDKKDIFPGIINIEKGNITNIKETKKNYNNFIIPGFVDAHVHIESSMLTPSEFARIAVVHGTIGVVADPHEIANVLGLKGIYYMIDNASKVPLKYLFGAPSCVPASPFEKNGSVLDHADIRQLLENENIGFLAEVMNYPGVINEDPEVMKKIDNAKKLGKPIDGHAPGLGGEELKKYISIGISTDHECTTLDEAVEKLKKGMKILIREGSAARDFDALYPLLEDHWDDCMFCSDDKHPDDLMKGHINLLVKKAVQKGIDPFKVLTAACKNPVEHYKLKMGLLHKGDLADFVIVDNLKNFKILKTFINGVELVNNGKTNIPHFKPNIINKFNVGVKKPKDFSVKLKGDLINVIIAVDGQLVTKKEIYEPKVSEGYAVSDIDNDILKITVVNRYEDSKPALGFIKNFGLKDGAIATSVAHDSHNIISVGTSDEFICKAVNLVIDKKGGICAVGKNLEEILPLPIAGIISDKEYSWVAKKYVDIRNSSIKIGSDLKAPFMTLSFMALPVIPMLKITDEGLFDAVDFKFIDLFVNE